MRGRKSAVKSCLNFVIDFMKSPLNAFGNSLATLDTHWKFSFFIFTTQTITSFLKLVLLLLSTCKKLCEYLCKLQYRRRILGSRALSCPCLQWLCVQPSPLFLNHILSVSCSTTSLLITTSRGLSCWFFFSFSLSFFSSTKCMVSFWQLVLSSKWYRTCMGFCESLAETLQWVD